MAHMICIGGSDIRLNTLVLIDTHKTGPFGFEQTTIDCYTWFWVESNKTVTLHMLNHLKLLQSHVVRSKPNGSVKCVSIKTNVYTQMCDPLYNIIHSV